MTEPPLKAMSSAGGMPPRAASATRAFALTERFMPMNPAAPESVPPITKPIAVSTFCSGISRIATTTPTPAMIVYWRFR